MSEVELWVSVVVEPHEDGYRAYCPAFEGVEAAGTSEDDALDKVREAGTAYLKKVIETGDPIPVSADQNQGTGDETVHVPPGATLKALELTIPIPGL